MVVTPESIVGTVGIAAALLALVVVMFRNAQQPWMNWMFSLGAGFIVSSLLLFVLPGMYAVSLQMAFFMALGVMLVPLLHMLLHERQSQEKKVRHPLAGMLSWGRVAVLALLYGDGIAMLGSQQFEVVIFSILCLFSLAPELVSVFILLHYEGARRYRAAVMTSILAVLPFVSALIVGTVLLVALPQLAAPFIALAAGTMLYMAVADRIAQSLTRRSWIELLLSVIGAAIAAAVAVFV